ncbi:MAG: metallophosphoesterase family protein [Actinomycetota bacterium]
MKKKKKLVCAVASAALVAAVFLPLPSSASTSSGDPVMAAAGDIACNKLNPNLTKNTCFEKATSDLVLAHPEVDIVQTIGDSQYPCGSYTSFLKAYDPTWGRFLSITRPAIGNHEVETSASDPGCNTSATGYFQYYGAAAQPNGTNAYYSYDMAGTGTSTARWRVVVLNGNCALVSCASGSPQELFLQSALSTTPSGSCIMAVWHQPRFNGSGLNGKSDYQTFWQDLVAAHVALVLNGHNHYYMRYVPQLANGTVDRSGVTEMIVGTGGASQGTPKVISPNVGAWERGSFGVQFLTLHATSYDWQFVETNGTTQTVFDSGSAPCTPVP